MAIKHWKQLKYFLFISVLLALNAFAAEEKKKNISADEASINNRRESWDDLGSDSQMGDGQFDIEDDDDALPTSTPTPEKK